MQVASPIQREEGPMGLLPRPRRAIHPCRSQRRAMRCPKPRLAKALPCHAEFHPSQTNSRQFGGMISSRSAAAIMP